MTYYNYPTPICIMPAACCGLARCLKTGGCVTVLLSKATVCKHAHDKARVISYTIRLIMSDCKCLTVGARAAGTLPPPRRGGAERRGGSPGLQDRLNRTVHQRFLCAASGGHVGRPLAPPVPTHTTPRRLPGSLAAPDGRT